MKNYLILSLVFISRLINGQSVGIGTTSPESSAILEIKSTTQGFMIPYDYGTTGCQSITQLQEHYQ